MVLRFSPFLPTFILLMACGALEPAGPDQPGPEPGELKVLFVGASYLEVNNLPGIFAGLSEAAGKGVFVGTRVRSGHYLDFFAQDQTTEMALGREAWDYVVLSGGCQTAAYPEDHHILLPRWDSHHPYPALRTLRDKILASHPETKIVYILPWAFEDGMTWVAGQTDDYFLMQEKIRTHVLAWSDSLDLVVAPVGMAWKTVMSWDVPPHFLHMNDFNHPSPRGSFLSAATVYSTLFQESSEAVGYDWILNSADARALRRVAAETVLETPDLWNIR